MRRRVLFTAVVLQMLSFCACLPANSSAGSVAIRNYTCEAWGWAIFDTGPVAWGWTAKIDPVWSRTYSNSSAITTTFVSNKTVFGISDTVELRPGSYGSIDADPRRVVDGGHYGRYAFDLIWQMGSIPRGTIYLCMAITGLHTAPDRLISYRTYRFDSEYGFLHMEGDLNDAWGSLAFYVTNTPPVATVPEPSSVLAICTGVAGASGLALRRRK